MKSNCIQPRWFTFPVIILGFCAGPGLAQSLPTIITQPVSQTVLIGDTVILGVTATGVGPFAYQWQFNGTNLPHGLITTAAGNGTQGYFGDGGAAINASLANPLAVSADAAGNLFIADSWNNCIRKVTPHGVITTVAGNGTAGYSGDGGAATNASLAAPSGVAVDAAGNLFIADAWNKCIRKVTAAGTITTVAGNGTAGYAGDGGAATNASLNGPGGVAVDAAGNLFIADTYNYRVRRVGTDGSIATVAGNGNSGYSGDGGVATQASLSGPIGVAVDAAGNLFIADTYNYRVRKVGTDGIITTVAGNGNQGYSGDGGAATSANLANPSGLAVDAGGALFIADRYNNRIRKVDTHGIITTVAGNGTPGYSGDGGAPTDATLNGPMGVAVDASGNLLVVDNGNSRIREITLADLSTLTLRDVAPADAGDYRVTITNPDGSVTSRVATITLILSPTITSQPASQNALPGDTVVLQVTAVGAGPFAYQWRFNGTNIPNSTITTVAGGGTNYLGDGDMATNVNLWYPRGVAVDAAGNLFITDTWNNRIRMVGADSRIITVAGGGTNSPGDGGAATDARLGSPTAVAVDGAGNLFIVEPWNNRVRKVDVGGVITTVAGNGTRAYSGDGGAATNASLSNPTGVAVDASGNLLIADQANNRVRKVDLNGTITTVAGNGAAGYTGDGRPATNAGLNPIGVAVDAFGNLLIADQANNRIRKVDLNGIITTVAGNGVTGRAGDGGLAVKADLDYPYAVAVDAAGNLFIADTGNSRIRKVGTNGIITTVAGNGRFGYTGDGGAATNASLASPNGVAVDAAANLFIADSGNSRIRKVASVGAPTLTLHNVSTANAGNYQVVITNSYGTVTSLVATITVALPPLTVRLEAGPAVALQGVGSPGGSYLLQAATNLIPPVQWQSVVTNTADANGYWSYLDTDAATQSSRFYRARQVP